MSFEKGVGLGRREEEERGHSERVQWAKHVCEPGTQQVDVSQRAGAGQRGRRRVHPMVSALGKFGRKL